jgi:hypothetical protein
MGVRAGLVGFGVGVICNGGAFGVALREGPGVGVCIGFGAGVDKGLTTGGFGFILVIRKDSFAPVPLGSHSMKL